ncbi:MAG: peptidoglycan DD-metalloendopeptidase family protein [Bacteroidales bacterium]|nr:peptidoglycan DD-metalloendopeptidase family protein [Bacteroidales bacterium]
MKAGKGRRYLFGLMVFCAIFSTVHTIQAQTAKQASGNIQTKEITGYRQEVQALQEEIKVINEQLTVLSRNHRNSLEEFNLVSRKADGRQRIVRSIENECARLEKAIDSTNRVIEYQGERLAKYEENYRKLLVNAYKHRDSRLWFMYLLASGDIEQGYHRWQYFKRFAKEINKYGKQIIEERNLMQARKASLMQLDSQSRARKAEAKAEYETLLSEKKDLDRQVRQLNSKKSAYTKELSGKRRQMEKLNREIERLIALEIQKAQNNTSTQQQTNNHVGVTSFTALNADFEKNLGNFPWPVDKGVITEGFGQRNHPVFKNVKLPFNNGVNISTEKMANVHAIANGTVSRVIAIPGYNQCVMIRHGDYFTFYCKLEKVFVSAGASVRAGEIIGYLDSENDDISILHFEIWKGTEKQDPELWLRKK